MSVIVLLMLLILWCRRLMFRLVLIGVVLIRLMVVSRRLGFLRVDWFVLVPWLVRVLVVWWW